MALLLVLIIALLWRTHQIIGKYHLNTDYFFYFPKKSKKKYLFNINIQSIDRVQVFDSNGIFVKEFGQYGNGEGEFDCLAGVAVNRIGQYIIADRYNHRIQVLDPQGRFLRSFGTQGISDGRFSYPWGVTTDALGFIYVCDKENHRVQVRPTIQLFFLSSSSSSSSSFPTFMKIHNFLAGFPIGWYICW